MTAPYVPLWCKSSGSFLEGASQPEELVERAAEWKLPAIAITDRDGVYGAVAAHVKAKAAGQPLIIGAEVTIGVADATSSAAVGTGATSPAGARAAHTAPRAGSSLVLLAADRHGYANLCRLLTIGRRRRPKGESRVTWREVADHSRGLLALWGGDRSLLVGESEPDDVATLLREAFGDRVYAMAARHHRDTEVLEEVRLRARAARYGLPVVAAVEVLYHDAFRRPLQDVMTCIRHGVTVHTAGRRLKPNAAHALPDPRVFAARFADDPAAVARTCDVAARCAFSMRELRYRYPEERVPAHLTSASWLRQLVHDGARARYPDGVPPAVRDQLEKELQIIAELDYGGYFLTMHEIVDFCRREQILCQGRGSAANSAVCYALGITAVDPVRMNLLFERFISKERHEPPDIDLDVMHERREEVIQHIYAKYGRDRAAMVAILVRYQPRSAVRDVGKALGLAETTLDRLSKVAPHYGDLTMDVFAEAGLDSAAPLNGHLYRLARGLIGAPRHLSIHPGGFLLGHEPVHDLVPIENATMADRTVIQWDKDDVEAIGLFKVDILGLGALSQLDRCFRLIANHRGVDLSMATLPSGDEATFAEIQQADTVGVFQIESRAQMSMLPRLKPENYYDLVIEISIVRPGPITGGMVHPYLRRRCKEESVEYPHECLKPVLERTKGVPLFQEQVMKIAIVAADYSPGEADQLRRDMAAWRKSGKLEAHHDRLVARMVAKGIAPEFAERVYKQICGFGEYGFPESHAASFALISYAAAYLRRHYRAEFTCALLNAQPMGFYSIATIVDDAKRHGVEVRPVDAARSLWDATLEPVDEDEASETGQADEVEQVSAAADVKDGRDRKATAAGRARHGTDAAPRFAVRMGLRFVKGMGNADGERWMAAREAAPFTSIADVSRRGRLDERRLAAIAEAGAFDAFGLTRREALWEIPGEVRTRHLPLPLSADEDAPVLDALDLEETIAWDYRASSHSVRGHPLESIRPLLRAEGLLDAKTVREQPAGARVRYAGLVICRQHPPTAKHVTFMTLEDETGFVNLVLWERVFNAHAIVAKTVGWLGVTGTIESKDGVVHIIAERLWVPRDELKIAPVRSRDFR